MTAFTPDGKNVAYCVLFACLGDLNRNQRKGMAPDEEGCGLNRMCAVIFKVDVKYAFIVRVL
jgi:hypothetical protein